MDDLLSEFLTEAGESLERLDGELVRLEQAPEDPALLAGIFRLVHTVKGTCGFLGLPRLAALAHAAETVLARFRAGELPVTPAAVGAILATLDRIRALLAALAATRAEPDGDDGDLIARLEALADNADVPAEAPEPPERPLIESEPGAASVRVHVALLDSLMTMAGELVLARNQLLQMARRDADSGFAAPLQRLSQITSELQAAVMQTRLQPVGSGWTRLPRLVRDLARELGKEIALETRGAETELDRRVIELIRDPLTHMVRNAADHGIEPPAERAACGKPSCGRIALEAGHEGGHVVIRISDDGRGIDPQVLPHIFKPGFSTAAAVTAVSGRGVGMDVVRTNIEAIGGHVSLRSEPGCGSTFTVRIPLTLAILPALIVESAGQRFAVPQPAIAELVRVGPGARHRIETIAGTPVMRLREGLLPLIALDRLLASGTAEEEGGERFVAVLRTGAARFGLVVDRVFDCAEVVVKPLAPMLRAIPVYAGATILGDGGVAMILDPGGIAASIGQDATARDEASVPIPAGEAAAPTALLVFNQGGGRKALPLARVARLEEIEAGSIEEIDGRAMVQYRGKLLPLVGAPAEGSRKLVVLTQDGRSAGLLADEIIDIVEDRPRIDLSPHRPGVLGTAIVAGRATQMLDAAHYLAQACGEPAAVRGAA